MSTLDAAGEYTHDPLDSERQGINETKHLSARTWQIAIILIGLTIIGLLIFMFIMPTPPELQPENEPPTISEHVPKFTVPPQPKPAPPEPKIVKVSTPSPPTYLQGPPVLGKPYKVVESITMPFNDREQRLRSEVIGSQSLSPTTAQRPQDSTLKGPALSNIANNVNLKATETQMVSASRLPNLNWIIPKGVSIPCAIAAAIQTDQPPVLECVISEDIYSADSKVVLIDRGSVATGEYKSSTVAPGKSRIFIIWDRVRTASGVVIDIASPSGDQLGRAGLGGSIDRHYFERFGAAILTSLIKDEIDGKPERRGQYEETREAIEDSFDEVTEEYTGIPWTLHKAQGAKITISVARDLDFSTVYGLADVN